MDAPALVGAFVTGCSLTLRRRGPPKPALSRGQGAQPLEPCAAAYDPVITCQSSLRPNENAWTGRPAGRARWLGASAHRYPP
jgi:hypothetical protein